MKNEQGFTMLELLIAIAILAIGLLGLATLQSTSIKENRDSKEMTTAVFLAEKKMEELKSSTFNAAPLNIGASTDSNNPMNGSGAAGGIFYRSWNVQNYLGSNNMKQITVSVSWTISGKSHSTSLNTVVAK
jgi:type IV pilus assembly protein PilV